MSQNSQYTKCQQMHEKVLTEARMLGFGFSPGTLTHPSTSVERHSGGRIHLGVIEEVPWDGDFESVRNTLSARGQRLLTSWEFLTWCISEHLRFDVPDGRTFHTMVPYGFKPDEYIDNVFVFNPNYPGYFNPGKFVKAITSFPVTLKDSAGAQSYFLATK